MKRIKDFFIAILILGAVGLLIYYIYQSGSIRQNRELAKRIAELSPRGGPPETLEGLKTAIALYEDQIERNIREAAQTGVYWKILGVRLADNKMDRLALDAFERAIQFNNQDASLYYFTGVSAAKVAKEIVGFGANSEREREHFFRLAENSYLKALELDVTYTRPMYGLGVLYVFELENRAQDAIIHLERYLQISTSDVSAMFVLASAYYLTENYSRAIELYDRILERTRDQELRREAMANKDFVQGMLYD
ncbi:MAG: CDC27 family protein [Treponema sp.]|nr:CDC27 family protein [Treponema sp.]MCL2237016.1 CDC27 family protein [Treponema sp.]